MSVVSNHPIHHVRTDCYACTNKATNAYRRPAAPTLFTCESHGLQIEEIHDKYSIPYTKIALVLPKRSFTEIRAEFEQTQKTI